MPDGSFVEPMTLLSKTSVAPDIHLVFAAREIAVRRAMHSICHALRLRDVDDLTLGTLEIVLAEVTNNIVEHAYPEGSDGTITLSGRIGIESIQFEVVDHGKMLPGGEVPSKQNHDLEIDLQDLPEGGFGWGLIRDITQNLAYRRDEDRNILQFAIARDTR